VKDHLSTAEAAHELGVSRNTLLRWFREGRIGGVGRDHNGWRRIDRRDLERIRAQLGAPQQQNTSPNPKMLSYLRGVPAFAHLPQPVLEQLAQEAHFLGFLRGQVIFSPGQRCRGLYIVVKGKVRLYRLTLEGREQTMRMAVPFQTLGESVVFRPEQRHTQHAVCMQSSTTLILPLGRLLPLTEANPLLAQAFLRELSLRLEEIQERLLETTVLNLEQRLARLLLEDTPACTAGELAAYLGAARESVSRVLQKFASAGWVRRQEGQFVILERESLASL
jgi:excisionase family DNA binding protein